MPLHNVFEFSCGRDNNGHVVVAFWSPGGRRPDGVQPESMSEDMESAKFGAILSPLSALHIAQSMTKMALRALADGHPALGQPDVDATQPALPDPSFDSAFWGNQLDNLPPLE